MNWRKNTKILQTEKIQAWRNGIMITGQMTTKDARRLVREGKAEVICEQAIQLIK